MKLSTAVLLTASVVVGSFGAALWSRVDPPTSAHAAEFATVFSGGEIKTDSIRARSIVVVDERGREQIKILGTMNGGGIWIGQGENKQIVSIYNLPGQGPVIGLTNTDSKAKNVCPLALSLADGKPSIQFEGKDGKLRWIGPDELEKLAK